MQRYALPALLALLVIAGLLALAAIVALAGCDSAGTDPEPYAGVVEVSLAPGPDGTALRLVAVDDARCNLPLVVESDVTPQHLDVRVVGIAVLDGPVCLAIIPAAAVVPLPFAEQGVFPITVAHRGATDAYAYSIGFAGENLDAVRTSTTRLATP